MSFCFCSYEEDDVTTVPENSVRPVARTALTWDQVEQLSLYPALSYVFLISK